MIRKLIRAVSVVALIAASVAHAGTAPAEVVATQVPTASEQVHSLGAKTQEVLELRKQVDELLRALAEVRSQLSHVPQFLDQSGSPITGS